MVVVEALFRSYVWWLDDTSLQGLPISPKVEKAATQRRKSRGTRHEPRVTSDLTLDLDREGHPEKRVRALGKVEINGGIMSRFPSCYFCCLNA